ncbi:MAG: efflux transporter periplasmic adaptor subunit, partial [Mesorhizobium sp.]
MRRIRWIVGIILVAAAAAFAAWYLWQPAKVSVVTPQRGDAAEIVYASGSVEPRTWAKVTPVVRERIVEQCNCEGSRVAQGDVLARLDDSEARAVLGELEARQALAQEELRRLTVLAERRAASQQALDRAQSELGQIEALVAGQKARLDTYVLRAPNAGVVLRQDGEVGEVAELGTVLF